MKVIKQAVIGEYNATQKVPCEKIEEKAGSRVLEVYTKERQKRFKKIEGAFRLSEEE
jgi:hypothetical protein